MSRVYVSSTFEDLKEHRECVYRQLRRVGHDVIAMEDYVAQDRRPFTKCRDDISDCDVYVGLFAWRYGYVPDDHNPRQLSITELEYRHAVDSKKECLVFLVDADFEWVPALQDSNTGDGKRGKLIKQLREALGKKTQVAFFKTPDHLASLVGAAVEKWKQKVDARKRDQASRLTIKKLTADQKIVVDRQIGSSRLLVINDDICNTATDIVVSSDDNYFTARDGVSKLLLEKLGPTVRRELEHYRSARPRFRQGQIAITTGGDWEGRRAIIHAAVIDLDNDLYPTREAIQTLTRRSLQCAVALGAESIAFPVLGGGYAGKRMKPSDCVNAMVTEMLAFIGVEGRDRDQLHGIKLYIFNPKDNAGLPEVVRDR